METPRFTSSCVRAEIARCLVALCDLRADALIKRLDLQRKLRVGNDRKLLTGLRLVAFACGERHDGATNSRSGDELVQRLYGGDDRFEVIDARWPDCCLARGVSDVAQCQYRTSDC